MLAKHRWLYLITFGLGAIGAVVLPAIAEEIGDFGAIADSYFLCMAIGFPRSIVESSFCETMRTLGTTYLTQRLLYWGLLIAVPLVLLATCFALRSLRIVEYQPCPDRRESTKFDQLLGGNRIRRACVWSLKLGLVVVLMCWISEGGCSITVGAISCTAADLSRENFAFLCAWLIAIA